MKKIHPWGRIPVLVTNKGNVLVESLVLLEYLEDTHPGSRSLRPRDAEHLARARMIALLFDHNVLKALSGVFAQLATPKHDIVVVNRVFDEVTAEMEKLVVYFDPIDKNTGPGVVGEISIADCALAPFAFLIDTLSRGFGATSPTQRVPLFTAWWSRISTVPEVKQVTDGMQAAFAAFMAAKKAAG